MTWGWGPGPHSDEPYNTAPPGGRHRRAEAFEAFELAPVNDALDRLEGFGDEIRSVITPE